MGENGYPVRWAQERMPSSMPSALKVSRRSRTLLLLAAALYCTYLFSSLLVGLPSRYSNFEEHADRINRPPADQHKHSAAIDSKASFANKEEIHKHEHAGGKIGKISMLYGDPNPTYERALRSHQNHAEFHHYPLFILRQKLLDRLWSKPAYIMSVLLQELEKRNPGDRLEWLFWFDADTYLLNQKTPLEIFLPPANFSHIHFMCGNDHNGLNDGSFFLRVNEWSLHLMAASISVETLRPEVNLKYSEQSAIEHLVKHESFYVQHTAIVPQRWYNAFMGPREWDGRIKANRQITGNSVQEGDLLVHFAGNGDTKKSRMTKFMNAFEKGRAQWELEVQETEIMAEMGEFWEHWAGFEREREEKGLPMPDKSVKSLGSGSKDGDRDAADLRADRRANERAHEQEIEHKLRRRW